MLETTLKAIIALLPVLVLVLVLYRLDSHRLLGTHFIAKVFLAGGVSAVLCAGIIVYLFRTHRIGFLIDAGILGFTVGAGFSLVENIYYLHMASEAHYGVWLVRGFGTAIMHGGATALFAIIAEVMTERHLRMNPLLYVPGLIVAYLVHAIFNHFPVSPALSTAVTLLILPTILFLLFERNQLSIHNYLEMDFNSHRQLLKQIEHGELSGCEAGRFLLDMQKKLAGPVAQEMIDYFCLHTRLVLSAESILLAREQGVEVEIGEQIKQQLQEMHRLEKHIGRAALRALQPHLHFSAKDMWEIHMLESEVA
jgi:hypothetical protein